jgi:hypothetical protein
MGAAKKGVAPEAPDAGDAALPSRPTQRTLPDARPPASGPDSVTQL